MISASVLALVLRVLPCLSLDDLCLSLGFGLEGYCLVSVLILVLALVVLVLFLWICYSDVCLH